MNPETPNLPPVLPKPSAKSSSGYRISTIIGISAAAVVGVVLVVFIYSQATRQDTEQDYVFLCDGLFQDLPVDGSPTIKPSDAEIQARVQQVMDEFAHISRRGRKLAPIAQKYFSVIQQALNIQQHAPQFSPVVFGSAEAALGIYTGQREVVGEGGQQALKGTEKLWNAFVAIQKLLETRQVLAIQLSDLAGQLAGQKPTGYN